VPGKSYSLQTLVLSTALAVLGTGLASWLTFGHSASIERARMDERVNGNSEKIDKLVTSVDKLTSSHAAFLQQIAALTARLDTYFESRDDQGA